MRKQVQGWDTINLLRKFGCFSTVYLGQHCHAHYVFYARRKSKSKQGRAGRGQHLGPGIRSKLANSEIPNFGLPRSEDNKDGANL